MQQNDSLADGYAKPHGSWSPVRAGRVSMLVLEWLRNGAQPPGSKRLTDPPGQDSAVNT